MANKFPPMSARKYRQVREALGLSNYVLHRKLGLSLAQVYRYENNRSPVSETVAKLLIMFDRHGIPDDF